MAEKLMDVGSNEGLQLRIEWCEASAAKSAAELTRGNACLWVARELVWGEKGEDGPRSFEWTWIELLEFLLEAWSYLEWEEGYPLGLQPARPALLRAVAEERWQDQTEESAAEEESVVFAFEENHDLARGLRGGGSSVGLARPGREFDVGSLSAPNCDKARRRGPPRAVNDRRNDQEPPRILRGRSSPDSDQRLGNSPTANRDNWRYTRGGVENDDYEMVDLKIRLTPSIPVNNTLKS